MGKERNDSHPLGEHPLTDPSSEAALELAQLLLVIAEGAGSDLGREWLQSLRPSSELEIVERRQAALAELMRLAANERLLDGFEEDLGPLLLGVRRARSSEPGAESGQVSKASELGGSLTPRELVTTADMLRAVLAAAKRIEDEAEQAPVLAERVAVASAAGDPGPFVARVGRVLDARGEVRDDASPKLASLRAKMRSKRESLYRSLSTYVEEHREVLAEETVGGRDGRLTVLLPSGSRGRLAGVTHGRSGTGRSYYFEPLEIVEENNELEQAREDEQAERQRLLEEIYELLGESAEAVYQYGQLFAELDGLGAVVHYAARVDAILAGISSSGVVRLASARHPLLLPQLADVRERVLGQAGHRGEVVPLDLEFHRLDGRFDEAACSSDNGSALPHVLVVTGPNAGGKTVALKTLGLSALAHQCGLPLPAAAGTQLPIFQKIVAVVGDEQDLLADRSTFSGRLLRLREAWEAAGPDSLVLLDEVGSGTNPEEGAALSVALLEGLARRGALSILVTHLTQLASAALETEGAGCAAMEFDVESLRPTFRLRLGPPGGSEALALAERLGLPRPWLARAEELVSDEHQQLRGLLRQVEESRERVRTLEETLGRQVTDQEKLLGRIAETERQLTEERRSLRRRLNAELEILRREVREHFEEEVARIEKHVAEGRRRGLVSEATKRAMAPERMEAINEMLGEPVREPEGEIVVGQPVQHRALGWEGVLEEVKGDRATVSVKGKRVRCSADELAPAVARSARGSKRGPKRGLGKSSSRSRVDVRLATSSEGDALGGGETQELNLVGQRVEPALARLDAWLDRALLSGAQRLRVIHGHGTGRLRLAVRAHLDEHPSIASWQAASRQEGGDGATVVHFQAT